VLKLVLDHIREMDKRRAEENAKRDKEWQAALEQHRLATEKFLGNHMSSNTHALESLVLVVESLAAQFDAQEEEEE
jgi:hypothetical protein